MVYSRASVRLPNFLFTRVRHFHCSQTVLKKPNLNSVKFPFLKDKSPIIQAYQSDEKLPFNAMRDILKVPVVTPESLDRVSFAWLDYFAENDELNLQNNIKSETPEEFWMKTIRVAISDQQIMPQIVGFIRRNLKKTPFHVPESIGEILVSSLIYSGHYKHAFNVYKDLLSYKENVNWNLILDVCLVLPDGSPLRVFETIHRDRNEGLYLKIISHLKHLKLKEQYIHSWNNKLVLLGDFPKDSSAPMNPVFNSMVETNNFRSFENCLKHMVRHLKREDIPHWLDDETSKYIAMCVKNAKDPASKVSHFISLYTPGSFKAQFFATLLHQTKIPSKKIMKLVSRAKIPENNTAIIEGKCKRLADSDPQAFWAYTDKNVEQLPPLKISVQILSLYLQNSDKLINAMNFAEDLILKYPEYTFKLARAFIMGVTNKAIETKHLAHHQLIAEFEIFLRKEKLMSDEIENYLVFSELKLRHFESALMRIERLLAKPNAIIERGTIENTGRILSKNSRKLPRTFTAHGESQDHYIMRLILRMNNKCDEVSPQTWNVFLKQIIKNFDHTEVEKFCLEVIDCVKSQTELNFNSANAGHPLRLIFDDKLITSIMLHGLKDPLEPWSGLATLSKLQAKGVYIPMNLMKKRIIEVFRTSGLPNSDKKKVNSKVLITSNLGIDLILQKINEIEQSMSGTEQRV